MFKWLVSTKGLVTVTVAFVLIIILFNVYDLTSDKSDSRDYTAQEIENMDIERININTADVQKLCEISGIGEITAQKIIEYREENGPFKEVEELINISGISETDLILIAPFVTI